MTNFGAHHLDIAQWGLGMDHTGPTSIEGIATFHPEKVHDVTETARITFTYDNGIKVICGQGQADISGGVRFIGKQGEVRVNRGKISSTPESLVKQNPEDFGNGQLVRSRDHTRNFLDCMRSRELPICDVEIGHRSATVCHLGNLVARLGRSIRWDPNTEQIIEDTEAQAMTDRPYRPPYSL
jgi:predicted dehydrogenase